MVPDPFLQDRQGNVSDDCDRFTPDHEGMGKLRFLKRIVTSYDGFHRFPGMAPGGSYSVSLAAS